METKICTICKNQKPIDQYYRYFSKVRNKYRIANACKICANRQAKMYYQQNKQKMLNYQNIERKDWKIQREKQHREQLSDRYILAQLKQALKGQKNKIIRLFPELIQAKRTQIITSRIIKKLKNGTK